MVQNLWSQLNRPAVNEVEELTYRSNLLGSDRRVCNWGEEILPLKQRQKILRVRK